MPILKVIQPTFLKRDPTKQAAALSPTDKYALSVGATLEITASASAANQHLQVTLKQPINGATVWFAFAAHVQIVNQMMTPLDTARDRQATFNTLFAATQQPGFSQDKLPFLDQGVEKSFLNSQISSFPDRLRQAPDTQTVASLGDQFSLAGTQQIISFSFYPKVGTIPAIDQTALSFLHPDIENACICIGSYVNGQMKARWLGRNALTPAQFWSSTKILPILNVVCQANAKSPATSLKNCVIRDSKQQLPDLDFIETAIDIISYRKDDVAKDLMMSNQFSGMLKRFSSLVGLEQWLAKITGNTQLQFRGYYGAPAYMQDPILQTGDTVILRSQPEGDRGENLITAYDLTRIMSMLGWHFHIPATAKLPAAQWHSLEAVVRSFGYDSARYIDVALQTLGLLDSISAPVVLSKLGFGPSDQRQRTELCFTALVQLIDKRPQASGKLPKFRTFAMTLRAAAQKKNAQGERDLDTEARWLDARMAAEVTEILRRIMTEELA